MSHNAVMVSTNRAELGHLIALAKVAVQQNISITFIVIGPGDFVEFFESLEIHRQVPDLTTKVLTVDYGAVANGFGDIYQIAMRLFSEIEVRDLFVLGDRFEVLAVVSAGLITGMRIHHIAGGETTLGAIDNQVRNAITQMADFHYVSHRDYLKNLQDMGVEISKTVLAGPLFFDKLSNVTLLSREACAKWLGIGVHDRILLVTFHPVTKAVDYGEAELSVLLSALEKKEELFLVFSGVNRDPGEPVIRDKIKTFVESHPRAFFFENLGDTRFFSLMKHAALVIGNSSSVVIEAPFLNAHAIVFGSRQQGRTSYKPLRWCHTESEVSEAIENALSLKSEMSESVPSDLIDYPALKICNYFKKWVSAR